ncbi:hypothetical protein BGZ54_005773 [Gamsiella multidivaricata]|nr:hypothetical protein BGZ54_005773 [Gamsiella multidivaricata]
MTFNLTSPELLDLDSYQYTLKQLIVFLAAPSASSSIAPTATTATPTTTEVLLGSEGAFVLDTSVTALDFLPTDSTIVQLTSSQNYPLYFIATSQTSAFKRPRNDDDDNHHHHRHHRRHRGIPATASITSSPVLCFICVPLNPLAHQIQCQLSARRLCTNHVSMLDRILRRLCDASPGAFMVGYSDGISGIDAGTEQQQGSHAATGANLEQSIALARDKGDLDINQRLAGLVSHAEHPAAAVGSGDFVSINRKHANSPPMSSSNKSAKALKKNESVVAAEEAAVVADAASSLLMVNGTEGALGEHRLDSKKGLHDRLRIHDGGEGGVLNYDFGLLDDTDQLMNVHPAVDIDELHDMLWAH